MKTVRSLIGTVVLVASLGVGVAEARAMPTTSVKLGAGNATASPCDIDGVAVSYTNTFDTTVAAYRTTAATVTGIATACIGRAIKLSIAASTGASLWQGTATVTGASMVLSTTSITSASIARWAIVLTG